MWTLCVDWIAEPLPTGFQYNCAQHFPPFITSILKKHIYIFRHYAFPPRVWSFLVNAISEERLEGISSFCLQWPNALLCLTSRRLQCTSSAGNLKKKKKREKSKQRSRKISLSAFSDVVVNASLFNLSYWRWEKGGKKNESPGFDDVFPWYVLVRDASGRISIYTKEDEWSKAPRAISTSGSCTFTLNVAVHLWSDHSIRMLVPGVNRVYVWYMYTDKIGSLTLAVHPSNIFSKI